MFFEKHLGNKVALYKSGLESLSQPTQIAQNIELTPFYYVSPGGQYIAVINNNLSLEPHRVTNGFNN
jgi:hypothetical protein